MFNYKLRAKNLVTKYNTNNPLELANELNIEIMYVKLPESIRGFFMRMLHNKFIVLNADLPYKIQKIVVSHELGHAILHKGYGYYLHADMNYYVPSKREKEANAFAVHLLAYSSDINPDLINKIINEKNPNPRDVYKILSNLI